MSKEMKQCSLSTPYRLYIARLSEMIKEERSNFLRGVDAASLALSKVRYF